MCNQIYKYIKAIYVIYFSYFLENEKIQRNKKKQTSSSKKEKNKIQAWFH